VPTAEKLNLALTGQVETPIGMVDVVTAENRVVNVHFASTESNLTLIGGSDPFQQQVQRQLLDYFQRPISLSEIPRQPEGTPFQQRVWQALCEIPLGEVVSYGELARQLGTSPRAVGGACRANPTPLIVPCHRVISVTGIGGFSGQWRQGEKVDIKRWLLRHEGVALG